MGPLMMTRDPVNEHHDPYRTTPPTTVGRTVRKTDKLIKRVGSRLRGPNIPSVRTKGLSCFIGVLCHHPRKAQHAAPTINLAAIQLNCETCAISSARYAGG